MKELMVQVVYCHCGKPFAAATLDHALTDPKWKASIKKYIKAGYKTEVTSKPISLACNGQCPKPTLERVQISMF